MTPEERARRVLESPRFDEILHTSQDVLALNRMIAAEIRAAVEAERARLIEGAEGTVALLRGARDSERRLVHREHIEQALQAWDRARGRGQEEKS